MTATTAGEPRHAGLARYAVLIFVLLTTILSVGLILLPLPPLVAPALVVFIPTLAAVALIALTEGGRRVRERLFSRAAWGVSLKWAAVALGLAVVVRLAIGFLATLLEPGIGQSLAGMTPLVVVTLLFAAGEEIGWRGYALPKLLEGGATPLAAALWLGLPWALMHLPLSLPGKLSAGTPMLAQFLTLLSLAVILTWLALAARRGNGRAAPLVTSIAAATLFHGGQNTLTPLTGAFDQAMISWAMAAVFGAVALIVIGLTRGRLGMREG